MAKKKLSFEFKLNSAKPIMPTVFLIQNTLGKEPTFYYDHKKLRVKNVYNLEKK